MGDPRAPRQFNLSQLRVLRSIQIDTWPRGDGLEDHRRHLVVMWIFSTITSPVFSELAIVLTARGVTRLPQEFELFETLDKMYQFNPFELVFLLDVLDSVYGEARRKFVEVLDSVTAEGLLDFLESPPTIRWVGSHHYGRDTTFADCLH